MLITGGVGRGVELKGLQLRLESCLREGAENVQECILKLNNPKISLPSHCGSD